MLFEDAEDLRLAEPRFLHDEVSSRPVASEFATYFWSRFGLHLTRRELMGSGQAQVKLASTNQLK